MNVILKLAACYESGAFIHRMTEYTFEPEYQNVSFFDMIAFTEIFYASMIYGMSPYVIPRIKMNLYKPKIVNNHSTEKDKFFMIHEKNPKFNPTTKSFSEMKKMIEDDISRAAENPKF